MKIIPIGDKVVVQRIEPEAETKGGIVLPDTARERSRQGRVVSVGDGRMLPDGSKVEPQVREGDRVLFSDFAGTDFNVDDEDLVVLSESDILAVLS